ncbi:TPA: hypothetical protein WHE80_001188, partial [Neisseria meningitidis]
ADYCADAAAKGKAENGGGQDADGVQFEFHRGLPFLGVSDGIALRHAV